MSLKKNLLYNGIATGFQKVVKMLDQLILVPFFISAWGAGYYGEWLTLTIMPSVIAFSDLGFGSAAANYFVLKYASGDKKGAANIGKAGFFVISIMIAVATLLSCAALVLLGYYDVFDNSLISEVDAIWSVSILILARLITFYSQLYEAQFRAARKAALSINLLSVNSVLNIVAGVIVLALGYGVIVFATGQLIVSVLFNAYYWYMAKRTLGLDEKGILLKEDIKAIVHKGFGYLMTPIWQVVYFQGSTFAVRLVLGPEAVAVFNTVRTLTRSINQLFNMVNTTVFPELQYEIGLGNMQRAQKLFRISILSVIIISGAGILFLALFGLQFYQIWTDNELDVPLDMWYLFIAGIFFNALWSNAAMVFRAVNKPYGFAIAAVLCSLISVSVSYWLAGILGLTGATVGYLVLDVILAMYVLPASCKMIAMPFIDIFSKGPADLYSVKSLILSKFKKA